MAVFPSFKLTKKGEELLNRSIGEGKVLTFTKFEIGDGNPPSDFREQTSLVNKFYQFPVLSTDIQKNQILRIKGYFDNKSFTGDKQLKEIGVFVKIENDETEYLYSYTNAGESGDIIPGNTRGFYSRTLDVANYIGYATNITFNIEQLRDRYAFNTENEMKVASYLKAGDKVELWGNLVLGDKPTDEYIIQESGEIQLSNGLFAKKVSFKYIAQTIEEMQKLALKAGDVVEVLGYYTAGDGAGHKRKIEDADDGSGVQLNNGKWANIVHNVEVNSSWLGCKYNSLESARTNYTNLLKAINYNQTVIINGDLYIEQNGDNVVISENLILKGKDNAKLILCTNLEKMDWFLINKNLKNLSFTDLEVKFNGTAERTSVLFAIDGMIKVNNCDIENCVFNINTNGRLMWWSNYNYNIKPDLSLHGFDVFNLKNNTFNNILNSFIVLSDVIHREFNIINNKINNFYYNFISNGTANESPFSEELTNNKLLVNVYNNTVINDDNFILNAGENQSYYCFVLFEANVINYKNNYIEGIKSQDIAPLYDAYFGGNYLYYENNTWKNNLCFNINKDNYQMMKSKEVVNKYYRNNTYIIEEEWLNKFNVDEKARIVSLEQQTSLSNNIVVDNNYIDVYSLQFNTSSQAITNYSFTNNKINCKKWTAQPFLLGYSNEKIANSDYIVKNNILNLGEGSNTQSFFQTFSGYTLNSIYRNIAIENNSFYFYFNDSVKIFYCIGFDTFGKNVSINNNSFIQTKKSSTELQMFQRYKNIYTERFTGTNNLFSSFEKVNSDQNYLFFNMFPNNKTDIDFSYKTTFNGKISLILQGFFDRFRKKLSDIPKIKYNIKLKIKNDSSIDKTMFLIFSLEKKNNIEIFEHYNSLGNLETTNIEDVSISEPKRFNMYLLNEAGNILKEYIFSSCGNNSIDCYLQQIIEYNILDIEINIIGG